MSARKRISFGEAEEILINLLKEITATEEIRFKQTPVSEYDDDMSLHIVSRICHEESGERGINRKDILHHPDVAGWARNFINSHKDGKVALRNLLIQQLSRAEQDRLFELPVMARTDRRRSLQADPRRSAPHASATLRDDPLGRNDSHGA